MPGWFWILGFGVWVLGFGVWGLRFYLIFGDFGFCVWVLVFDLWVLGFGCWVWIFGLRVGDLERGVRCVRFRFPRALSARVHWPGQGVRSRSKREHLSQSRPDSGLGIQAKVLKTL